TTTDAPTLPQGIYNILTRRNLRKRLRLLIGSSPTIGSTAVYKQRVTSVHRPQNLEVPTPAIISTAGTSNRAWASWASYPITIMIPCSGVGRLFFYEAPVCV